MRDYFGIEYVDISRQNMRFLYRDGKVRDEIWGMGLVGMPEFKQYCRDYVNFWRDERELI